MKSGNLQFGQRIKELREEKKLTQEQLAELMEVEYQTINRIENGIYFTNYKNLEKFANIFNVSIDSLFEYSHKKTEIELRNEIIDWTKNCNTKQLEFLYKTIRAISQFN